MREANFHCDVRTQTVLQNMLLILGLHFIFGSWQTLVTSFLSREPDFFCAMEGEVPKGIFDSLDQWRNFSNPVQVKLLK